MLSYSSREEHREEGDGASEREDGIYGVWALKGGGLGRRVQGLAQQYSDVFFALTRFSPHEIRKLTGVRAVWRFMGS